MRIVIVEPGKVPYEKEIVYTLKAMQDVVDGYIETIGIQGDLIAVMNEEGKLLNLPPNREFYGDILCGTFFLTARNGDEFRSLTDEEITFSKEYFKEPEIFADLDRGDFYPFQPDDAWEPEL